MKIFDFFSTAILDYSSALDSAVEVMLMILYPDFTCKVLTKLLTVFLFVF